MERMLLEKPGGRLGKGDGWLMGEEELKMEDVIGMEIDEEEEKE